MLKKEQGNAILLRGSVINSIGEFKYSPEEEVTFIFAVMERFFKKIALHGWTKRKCLLLEKIGQSKHEKYANYILPRNPGETP